LPDQQQILGEGMTDRMWEATTNHAKTCVPGHEVHASTTAHGSVHVDSVFNLVRVEIGGVECPVQQLDRAQSVSSSPIHYSLIESALLKAAKFPV
jgi:hypothetical protein